MMDWMLSFGAAFGFIAIGWALHSAFDMAMAKIASRILSSAIGEEKVLEATVKELAKIRAKQAAHIGTKGSF